MRLGQLARKLALRPSDIVDCLAENNIRIANGTNTRLENEHVNLIMKRFVPGWVEAPIVEDIEDEEEIIGSEPVADVTAADDQVDTTIHSDMQQDEPTETSEVIRAPKIELTGLKVVGKIDLPEPKKKEEPGVEEKPSADEGKKERSDNRKPFVDENRNRRQRPEKNPVALQREKEAKQAQKKLLEQQARDKEKRTQNYLKNYKPASPTKAAKLIKEDVVEMTPQELEEPPKTIFGKILRWLTKAS